MKLANPTRSHSLRRRLLIGLGILALAPAALIAAGLAVLQARQISSEAVRDLGAGSRAAALQLDQYLDAHVAAVQSLAAALASDARMEPAGAAAWLQRYHTLYPGFRTLLAADGQGRVIVGSQRDEEGIVRTLPGDGSVADRAYFIEPMHSGRPYLSRAFRGRGSPQDVIVAVSTPVLRGDAPAGIAEGSLDLGALAAIDRDFAAAMGAALIVLDERDQLVYASPSFQLQTLEDLQGNASLSPLLGPAKQSGELQWHPAEGSSQPLRFGRAVGRHGWQLVLLKPRAIEAAATRHALQWALLVFLAAAAGAAWLARLLHQETTRPLAQLERRVSEFRMDGARRHFADLRALPTEYRRVFRHLHRMAWRLRAGHARLAASLEDMRRVRNEMMEVVVRRNEEVRQRTHELADANRELQRLSRVDPLTGLANRRGFAGLVDLAWKLGLREGVAVAFVVIDVDQFAAYNDAYGHEAGDICLRKIAAAIQGCAARPLDLPGRYAGEQFALVLSDTTLEGVTIVGERIRATVEGLALEHRTSRVADRVTVSIGVCAFVPDTHYTPEFGLQLANKALYAAKRAGRNCVASINLENEVVISRAGRRTDLPPADGRSGDEASGHEGPAEHAA